MSRLRHADIPREQIETMERQGLRNMRAIAIMTGIDPKRLKAIRIEACPWDEYKSGLHMTWEPELTEAEDRRFREALDSFNRFCGGSPIVRPARA